MYIVWIYICIAIIYREICILYTDFCKFMATLPPIQTILTKNNRLKQQVNMVMMLYSQTVIIDTLISNQEIAFRRYINFYNF